MRHMLCQARLLCLMVVRPMLCAMCSANVACVPLSRVWVCALLLSFKGYRVVHTCCFACLPLLRGIGFVGLAPLCPFVSNCHARVGLTFVLCFPWVCQFTCIAVLCKVVLVAAPWAVPCGFVVCFRCAIVCHF